MVYGRRGRIRKVAVGDLENYSEAAAWRDSIGQAGDAEFCGVAIRGLEDFHALPDADKWSFSSRMLNILRVSEEAFILHAEARLDERYWLGIRRHLETMMNFRHMQVLWDERRHYFHDEFQIFVDDLVGSSDAQADSYGQAFASRSG